jgi:hypothetical protein
MQTGMVKTAERKALNLFDKWNDVTGLVQPHTSYYYELQGVIEDAVHVGIQMALNGKLSLDEDGDLIKE